MAPHTYVQVLGQKLVGFFDSGSSVSAINYHFRKFIPKNNIHSCHLKLRSAQGTFFCTKKAELRVNCGNVDSVHTFLIMKNLPKQILLGFDFMRENKISLHPATNQWEVSGVKLPFVDLSTKCNLQTLNLEAVDFIKVNHPVDFQEFASDFFTLVESFAEIFSFTPGIARCEPMRIDTGTAQPVAQPQRRMSHKKAQLMEESLAEMLAAGQVVHSDSPWRANFVMAPKPDGQSRPCGDYRQLNDLTRSDAYPMPNCQEILDWIGQSKVFSTFDLTKGYYQIPIAEEDQCKTAVWSPSGLYHYKVMPFGLKTAPKVFQRLMNAVLAPFLRKFAMVFLDDVIIYSKTPQEHLEHLRQFFEAIQKIGLTLNPKKVQPFRASIKVLGHIVSDGLVSPSDENVHDILELPRPHDLTTVRRFLGMTGYYRTLIPGYAFIAQPLYKLLRKDQPFCWLAEQESALNSLKQAVINVTVALPDLNGNFVVQTDASGLGLGAVLMTVLPEGKKLPVSFISRVLHGGEKNYTTTELECLAVVWALEKFRPYLEHTSFTVETDHMAIKWLMTIDKPKGRIARWIMKLQTLEFEIVYRPGRLNWVADCLSRAPVNTTDKTEVLAIMPEHDEPCSMATKDMLDLGLNPTSILSAQKADKFLNQVREYLTSGSVPDAADSRLIAKIKTAAHQAFIAHDGVLIKWKPPDCWDEVTGLRQEERIMLPEALIRPVIAYYHSSSLSGHHGADIVSDRVSKRFYFLGLKPRIVSYIQGCMVCLKYNYENQKPGGLMKIRHYLGPWDEVSVDLIGPLPSTRDRNVYLLVIIDIFSNWVECFPLKASQVNSRAIIDKLLSVFCRWGYPHTIISDNGPQFISKLWNSCMQKLCIKVKHSSPYHPQANPVERKNRDIKLYLSKFTGENHATWDQFIQPMLFSMRTAINRSTGFTPAKLLFGRELRAPPELCLEDFSEKPILHNAKDYVESLIYQLKNSAYFCHENRQLSSEIQKNLYDQGRREITFKEGEQVLCRAHPLSSAVDKFAAKLAPKREGPYIILEFQPPNTYVLGDPETLEAITLAPVHFLRKCPQLPGENPENIHSFTATQPEQSAEIRSALAETSSDQHDDHGQSLRTDDNHGLNASAQFEPKTVQKPVAKPRNLQLSKAKKAILSNEDCPPVDLTHHQSQLSQNPPQEVDLGKTLLTKAKSVVQATVLPTGGENCKQLATMASKLEARSNAAQSRTVKIGGNNIATQPKKLSYSSSKLSKQPLVIRVSKKRGRPRGSRKGLTLTSLNEKHKQSPAGPKSTGSGCYGDNNGRWLRSHALRKPELNQVN